MKTSMHPTKVALIDTALRLTEEEPEKHVTTEELLEAAHVSRSSLYHHFHDFNDLLETAQVIRFARSVDAAINTMNQIVASSHSHQEFRDRMIEAFKESNDPDLAVRRAYRVRMLAQATEQERFARRLGREQQRLTAKMTSSFEDARARGLIRSDADPELVATMVQVVNIGKIVSDINPTPIDDAKWSSFITSVFDSICTPD